MESLTEEELVQMVRDFIESESAPSPTSVSESLPLNHPPTRITLQEMIWRATDCEIELLEKILMYVRNMESDLVDSSNLKKGLVMKLQMDGYEASLCKTSWASTLGRPKGDYEYIDVMVMEKKNEEDGKQTRVIVDVDFRSQFEVARPTPTYEEIVANLPSIFVGTEEKLESVISLLCSAAKESMKERGLHIPPWRKASYMQSKWLSKDCNKVSFSPNNNNIGIMMEKSDGKCTSTH